MPFVSFSLPYVDRDKVKLARSTFDIEEFVAVGLRLGGGRLSEIYQLRIVVIASRNRRLGLDVACDDGDD